MTYATGSASTTKDYMDAVIAFAVANAGMTLAVSRTESWNAFGTGSVTFQVKCLTKGASVWWIAYSETAVLGFLALSSAGTQFGVTGGSQAGFASAGFPYNPPYSAYHLFTEGTCVHAVAVASNGSCIEISFGDITKYGTWTGGHYFVATNYDSSNPNDISRTRQTYLFGNPIGNLTIGALFGGLSQPVLLAFNSGQLYLSTGLGSLARDYPFFSAGGENSFSAPNSFGNSVVRAMAHCVGIANTIIAETPNVFNNRAPGVRCELQWFDDTVIGGTQNLWRPLGYIPNIRAINVNLLNPGDVVNTDWLAFPVVSKNPGISGQFVDSFESGFAYRK